MCLMLVKANVLELAVFPLAPLLVELALAPDDGVPVIATSCPTCSLSLLLSPESCQVFPLLSVRVKLPAEPLRQPCTVCSPLVLVCAAFWPDISEDGFC